MNLLIPAIQTGMSADDHKLEPGAKYVTNYDIRIAEPLGAETLKLFLSTTPIDLSSTIATRGGVHKGPRGRLSPLEKMFQATYQREETRGGAVIQPSLEEVGVASLFFKIVEK